LQLEHGKPLVFGKNRDKGIRRKSDGDIESLHSETASQSRISSCTTRHHPRPSYAFLLSHMEHRPGFPTPIGVFRAWDDLPRYEDVMNQQINDVIAKRGAGDLNKILHAGDTWKYAKGRNRRLSPIEIGTVPPEGGGGASGRSVLYIFLGAPLSTFRFCLGICVRLQRLNCLDEASAAFPLSGAVHARNISLHRLGPGDVPFQTVELDFEIVADVATRQHSRSTGRNAVHASSSFVLGGKDRL